MDRMIIRGGSRIEGSVQVCGAKNAALPQIAAALLSAERLELGNVPEVSDIDTMLGLMQELGVAASRAPGHRVVLDAGGARNTQAPYDIVRKMRASILVLAPLLARFGSARVSQPGGCAIGARPIDLHLKALEALALRDFNKQRFDHNAIARFAESFNRQQFRRKMRLFIAKATASNAK